MKFFIFVAAAVLSLPKQLVTVYIGVLLGESINGTSSKERIASALLSVVSFIITTIAYKFLNREINKIKPEVIYERRKARYLFFPTFP